MKNLDRWETLYYISMNYQTLSIEVIKSLTKEFKTIKIKENDNYYVIADSRHEFAPIIKEK